MAPQEDEEINCNLLGFKPLQYESVLKPDFCHYSAQLHMLIRCSHMHPSSRSPTIHNPISFQHRAGTEDWLYGIQYLGLICLTFRSFQWQIQGTEEVGGKILCVDGAGSPAQSSSSSEMAMSLHLLLPRRSSENVQRKHHEFIIINKALSPDIQKRHCATFFSQLYYPKRRFTSLSQTQLLQTLPTSQGQGWLWLQVPTAPPDTQK